MANSFLRKVQKDVGVTSTAIGGYTVASATVATVIGLNVANVSTASITVDIELYSGAIIGYILKGAVIPAGGALVAVGGDQKIVLQAGDSVRIKSSAATSADAIMSILEIA